MFHNKSCLLPLFGLVFCIVVLTGSGDADSEMKKRYDTGHYLFRLKKNGFHFFRLRRADATGRATEQRQCATNSELVRAVMHYLCVEDPASLERILKSSTMMDRDYRI